MCRLVGQAQQFVVVKFLLHELINNMRIILDAGLFGKLKRGDDYFIYIRGQIRKDLLAVSLMPDSSI